MVETEPSNFMQMSRRTRAFLLFLNLMREKAGTRMVALSVCLGIFIFSTTVVGQEINREGWPIPDLTDLIPYTIQIEQIDGVEKMVEKFYTPHGGHIARISGNNKIFAYAVDHDREPPIDYLILDPEGVGKFTQKLKPEESYKIPEWVSH
jgi:hypothetical protein